MKQSTVQIDQAGRVVLPKNLRERFRLRGGDTLEVEVKGDAIELRPTQAGGKLKRVNGILVFSAPGNLEPNRDFAAESREERLEQLSPTAKERR